MRSPTCRASETGLRLSARPGIGSRRGEGLPGYWTVLFIRAMVEHPAGYAPLLAHFAQRTLLPSSNSAPWASGKSIGFGAACSMAHTFACLRIAEAISGTGARLATGSGGLTLGRAGFAPAGRQTKFHEGIFSSFPFDQHFPIGQAPGGDHPYTAPAGCGRRGKEDRNPVLALGQAAGPRLCSGYGDLSSATVWAEGALRPSVLPMWLTAPHCRHHPGVGHHAHPASPQAGIRPTSHYPRPLPPRDTRVRPSPRQRGLVGDVRAVAVYFAPSRLCNAV